MNISSSYGTTRMPVPPADTGITPASSRVDAASAAPNDQYKAPEPPRFPWLSRLAIQLEASATQRAAFRPAPILGDNVNQAA